MAGMVIVESTPPNPGGGLVTALLAMITPVAPAFCAFLALTTNVQVPRSMMAMLPATAAKLVNGSHPSLAAPTPSLATTTLPWKLDVDTGGPKLAVPYLSLIHISEPTRLLSI